MARTLDSTDWRILDELQRDGRLSYNQLARRVNLSSPAVAERVRRLEESGVIAGYQAKVDPAKAGMPLTAFIEMRCAPGRCLLKTSTADDLPEVVEIHKLSGNSCTILKVRVASLQDLEGLNERLGEHGEINTHVGVLDPVRGTPGRGARRRDAHRHACGRLAPRLISGASALPGSGFLRGAGDENRTRTVRPENPPYEWASDTPAKHSAMASPAMKVTDVGGRRPRRIFPHARRPEGTPGQLGKATRAGLMPMFSDPLVPRPDRC
jgi:Lrp/AsnC family leucine-responsive transcriptional regulator